MKDFHSEAETYYRKRLIAPLVRTAIDTFPAVVVSGARQVGKSTMLLNEFNDFKYITLDDYPSREQAQKDPQSLWIDAASVIIDEAQKVPEVFDAIKLTIDKSKRQKRFLISGSSNILLMKNIRESLAGRAVYFDLLPMGYGEMATEYIRSENFSDLWKPDAVFKEQETEFIDPVPFILKGSMPPLLALEDRRAVLTWWEGYVKTYVERDVVELSRIESTIDFKKILDSLALRTGGVVNQADISRDTGVSQPTTHRYISLLEVSNIISRVPPYFKSRTKRIAKSPKLFFFDPGLAAYLAGYYSEEVVRNAREVGNFFESLVFLQLKILASLTTPKTNIFYWRTTSGREVDFVLEYGNRLLAIEVKLTRNPSIADCRNLLSFCEEHEAVRGVVIHTGNTVKYLHTRILAVPWWWVW